MNIEDLPEIESTEEERRHPKPEELMLKQALKTLTKKQIHVWELYAYDRMTLEDIAKLKRVTKQAISKQIKTIEKRIATYIKSNMGAYNLLKEELGEPDEF